MATDKLSTDPERMLKDSRDPGFVSDIWDFLRTSKKWWMVPMLVIFLLMGILLVLAKTAAAPFIYTLF